MNLRVNLTKRINMPEGFRYYPVVMSGNGRVKPGAVIVNGEEEKHTEGAYYIEWYEGTKRKRKSVGTDPQTPSLASSAKKQN
jgi:integrase/recombinase XerD